METENKIYKITLADGTVLDNLRRSGTTFIADSAFDTAVFDGNCAPVTISDGESEEIHDLMEYVVTAQTEGEFRFNLRDMSAREIKDLRIDAAIEYIAMMAGVEL